MDFIGIYSWFSIDSMVSHHFPLAFDVFWIIWHRREKKTNQREKTSIKELRPHKKCIFIKGTPFFTFGFDTQNQLHFMAKCKKNNETENPKLKFYFCFPKLPQFPHQAKKEIFTKKKRKEKKCGTF